MHFSSLEHKTLTHPKSTGRESLSQQGEKSKKQKATIQMSQQKKHESERIGVIKSRRAKNSPRQSQKTQGNPGRGARGGCL